MVTDLDTALAALADPTRRHVVELLRTQPRRTGELASACGVSSPAMSKHLRILRGSGVVAEVRIDTDARIHLYELRPEPFRALQAWLDQVHAYWTEQLTAFQAHVDQRLAADQDAQDAPEAEEDRS